ncbi:hypothetical protein BDN72DRAFT_906466 [Pluteus cervinus]|uniref:Uncharacterized protein n=1 Tax=Pluteus cervinus TaxID=181527 RepID=A0ACD2ZZ48_9AGAR|nr:hypothetical protein BDN72DRAFT_906466 [Pluteus cervinus]
MANSSIRLAPPRLTRDALTDKRWVVVNDGGHVLTSQHNTHLSNLPASFFSILAHVEHMDETPVPEAYRPSFTNTYTLRVGPSRDPERARSFFESIKALQVLEDTLGPNISVHSPIKVDSAGIQLQLNVPIADSDNIPMAVPLTLFDDHARIQSLGEYMRDFPHGDIDFMIVLRQFSPDPSIRQVRVYTQLARLCH